MAPQLRYIYLSVLVYFCQRSIVCAWLCKSLPKKEKSRAEHNKAGRDLLAQILQSNPTTFSAKGNKVKIIGPVPAPEVRQPQKGGKPQSVYAPVVDPPVLAPSQPQIPAQLVQKQKQGKALDKKSVAPVLPTIMQEDVLASIPDYSQHVMKEATSRSDDSTKSPAPVPKNAAFDKALNALVYTKPKTDSSLLEPGNSLAPLKTSQKFSEASFLGTRDDGVGVYLNTHEPFCIAAVGVQGSGKSHSLGVILENCLIPLPRPVGREIIRLQRPMTALVLHYDQNVTSICEATGLICPSSSLSGLTSEPIAVPQSKMIVLVSPSYYAQRKKFYGDYCIVKPLLFQWSKLSADHIKKLMGINESDSQLYIASLLNLLRSYQRSAVIPEFHGFLEQVKSLCKVPGQSAPLQQRIALLESFVAESKSNASYMAMNETRGGDLSTCLGPGVVVVADLTDPLLSSAEANGIFQVLTEQFRTVHLPDRCGKILALDEAHKFMDGVKSDGLSNAIINAARLMRHDGLRLVVSTQSPKALAPELLELVTVALLHRFHSRDWFTYLSSKIPLKDENFDELINLPPGAAITFAARHLLDDDKGNIMHLTVRQRITEDRGASRTNN